MNLHEYQGKALFADYGLPVSVGQAVDTPEAAEAAAREIGGDKWVVKAQVHAGGRGKAGGVKLIKNFDNLENRHCMDLDSLTSKNVLIVVLCVVTFLTICSSFNRNLRDVNLTRLILGVDFKVSLKLVIKVILCMIVVKLALVSFHHNLANVDSILDVALLADSLDLSIDLRLPVACRHTV